MSAKFQAILAISQRSTRCGVAVFEGDHLINYGVVSNDSFFSKNLRVERSLDTLLNRYRPELIATEELIYPQHETRRMQSLWLDVQELAISRGVQVSVHSPHDVRKFFSTTKLASSHDVALQLIVHYPELRTHLGLTSRQTVYWKPLFNAVALGRYFVQMFVKEKPLI